MSGFTTGLVGVVLAGGLLWARETKVTRPWLRRLLLVLAILLFYPLLNSTYVDLKDIYHKGQQDAASERRTK